MRPLGSIIAALITSRCDSPSSPMSDSAWSARVFSTWVKADRRLPSILAVSKFSIGPIAPSAIPAQLRAEGLPSSKIFAKLSAIGAASRPIPTTALETIIWALKSREWITSSSASTAGVALAPMSCSANTPQRAVWGSPDSIISIS